VLESLRIPRGQIVYVQSSVDWIERAGFRAAQMLAALVDWVGDRGTLVMPSYPFHTTHQAYLESSPSFDVRRTPSAMGLLPEIFRRTSGVIRSLDPDFPVAALGPEAGAIVGTEAAALDPFGLDSSYQRMLDRHATHVGLGVSLNTHSFIHVIDSRAEPGYLSPVYLDRTFSVNVVDAAGRTRLVQRKALRPQFQQLTTPSSVVSAMAPNEERFSTLEIEGAMFFRWDLDRWAGWCLDHARLQAAACAWPCWLSRFDNGAR
jgi:aminoglycoside 3-N-acetyltransferase